MQPSYPAKLTIGTSAYNIRSLCSWQSWIQFGPKKKERKNDRWSPQSHEHGSFAHHSNNHMGAACFYPFGRCPTALDTILLVASNKIGRLVHCDCLREWTFFPADSPILPWSLRHWWHLDFQPGSKHHAPCACWQDMGSVARRAESSISNRGSEGKSFPSTLLHIASVAGL